MGEEPPHAQDDPPHDLSLSVQDRATLFMMAVSSYSPPPTVSAGQPGFEKALLTRGAALKAREYAPHPDIAPTAQRMSSAELAGAADPAALHRSQRFLLRVDPAVHSAHFRRAFLECAGAEVAWPAVPARVLWCDRSMNSFLYAAHRFEELAAQHRASGLARDAVFFRLQGANHLVHWDEPERFTRLLARIA